MIKRIWWDGRDKTYAMENERPSGWVAMDHILGIGRKRPRKETDPVMTSRIVKSVNRRLVLHFVVDGRFVEWRIG